MKRISSLTGRAAKFLMLSQAKMKKDKQLVSGVTMVEKDNNGKLSISIKQKDLKPRVLTKTLASMSTDHSILCQNYHSTELLSAMVLTMYGREDGDTIPQPNNGSSMVFPRPSRTTNGSLTHLISNPTVVQPMSDALLPTQDGGNCGDTKEVSL